jgi:hypothetical protein
MKTKTRKNKNLKNKTAKIYAIPSVDKDIKAIIDINAIKNNFNYLNLCQRN